MATEEENFDIDIYGDGGEDYQQDEPIQDIVKAESVIETSTDTPTEAPSTSVPIEQEPPNQARALPEVKHNDGHPPSSAQKISSTDDSSHGTMRLPRQAPQMQGIRRQESADDRFVDPGATTALFISDLHWWVTDDDIRGWANQSECEDELQDITFSEHKVNGKSKG